MPTRRDEPGPPPPPGNRALFVDRDGTLVPDLHYLAEPDRLEVYLGVSEALRAAHDRGWQVICVTNQSGIERGFYTPETVEAIHRRLNDLLARGGAHIDAFYFCPHVPETGCRCRKPGTELFERASTDRGIDFALSAVVGDRWLDVEAGRRLGMMTALVPPIGHEREVEDEMRAHHLVADIHAASFREAVTGVLARSAVAPGGRPGRATADG